MTDPDTCTECNAEMHGRPFSKRTTLAGRIATCSLGCHEDSQRTNGRGTAYRLTSDDEARSVARMTEAHADGCRDLYTLQRLGAHAIGCSAHDLRDVELLWIAARARDILAPVPA